MSNLIVCQKHLRSQLGFTLLELMIAVVIIGILAVIAVPSYKEYVRKSDRSAVQAQMLRISERLAAHRALNLSYKSFNPTPLYGSSVDTSLALVTLPVGATGSDIKYTLRIMDISGSTPAVLNPTGTATFGASSVGRQWAIRAERNDNASTGNSVSKTNNNMLLTSTGIKCMTKDELTTTTPEYLVAYQGCGSNSQDW